MNADKDYGYIKQSRKQFQGDDLLWDDGTPFDSRSAWTWLIQAAAWKDTVYHSRSRMDALKRGEFVASYRFLGARWKWNKNRVHRFIKLILKAGRIELAREGQHGHVYHIVNYDTYQTASSKTGTVRPTEDGTANGTPTGHRRDKEEAVKQLRTTNYSTDFEVFWQGYPKRSGSNPKKRAFQAYCARIAEGHSEGIMLAGRDRYKAHLEAEGNINTRYVQQAATFLGTDLAFLEEWAVGAAVNGDRLLGAGHEVTVEELASIGIRL